MHYYHMGSNLSTIFRILFVLAAPPSAVLLLFEFLINRHGIDIPGWLAFISAILSLPAALSAGIVWSKYRIRREAAAVGAMMPPEVSGRWPGNIDIVFKVMKEFYNGYPGEQLNLLISGKSTVNLRWLWEDSMMTLGELFIRSCSSHD